MHAPSPVQSRHSSVPTGLKVNTIDPSSDLAFNLSSCWDGRAFRKISLRSARMLAWIGLTLSLTACGLPKAASPRVEHDLGPLPLHATGSATTGQRAVAQAVGRSRQLHLMDTSAPAAMSSQDMRYRLVYAQSQQPKAYSQARWTMAPPQLVHQRLRQALAEGGWLLAAGHASTTPVLQVEVDAFEQVFDSPDTSHAHVQWQVSLRQGAHTVAQTILRAQAPAASPDATGGAQALAVATQQATAQLLAWLNEHGDRQP